MIATYPLGYKQNNSMILRTMYSHLGIQKNLKEPLKTNL